MREIIASAICQSGFLPELTAKIQILLVIKVSAAKNLQKKASFPDETCLKDLFCA
jgi:hypothetical protein